jgi:hypothetical protein
LLIKASTSDAILLKQETTITIKNNKLISNHFYDIQINNSRAEKLCKVSIPFDKLIKITSVSAIITDRYGNIVKKLKSADITKKSIISNAAFFQDAMTMEFNLQHNTYPYRIQYRYNTVQTQYLYITKWIPVLDTDVATKEAKLTLLIPDNYKFRYKTESISEPEIVTGKGTTEYRWSATFQPLPEYEEMAPYPTTMMPVLSIVPTYFKFETPGSFESWETYGNWQYNIISKLQQVPENEVTLIRNLISGTKDTTEMVRRIYHYLQDHTRYVNVSLETGGMIPVAAELVSKFKYGDCKGLTNYMMSLLLSVGIKSHYTDVHAGVKIKPIDLLLPAQQFNHVILSVPVSGDTLWLDCTSKGPFNYVGTFIQNRPGFIVDKSNSKTVTIPALEKQQVLTTRNIQISRLNNEINRVVFSNIYRGENFELLSEINRSAYDKQKYLQRYFGLKKFETDTYNTVITHRDSAFAKLTFTASTKSCIEKVGNHLLIKTGPFDIPQLTKPEQRKYPLQIDFPVCQSDTQIFSISEIHYTQPILQDIHFETAFGVYTKSYNTSSPSTIRIEKYFAMNKGAYSLSEYPEIFDFIRRVTDAENQAIIIKSDI